jgi:hypothetical protein
MGNAQWLLELALLLLLAATLFHAMRLERALAGCGKTLPQIGCDLIL